MLVDYSFHAKEQIILRKIELVWIEETLKYPHVTEKLGINKYFVRRKLNERSLEVIFLKEKYIKIVTVYWI